MAANQRRYARQPAGSGTLLTNERLNSIVDAGPGLGSLRLERVLGRGGHAVVYAAHQLGTGRELAVKVVDLGDSAERASLRFAREVQATRRAEHPNVVRMFGFATTADGAPCLILELLQGHTLQAELAARQRLPPAEALRIVLPLMGALSLLHQASVVHRDISPSNIFLAEAHRRTVPKLLDFGIAKHAASTQLTRTGAIAGTVEYMSPEQATDSAVGSSSDVWAMGVVLYRALSGVLPFSASTAAAVLFKIVNELPCPLQRAAPEVGPRLSAAIDKALRRRPADRYPSMLEFARALVLAANADGIALPRDPDPLGLPDFPKWLIDGEGDQTRTVDHPVALARGPMTSSRALSLGVVVLGIGAIVIGLARLQSRDAVGASAAPVRPAVSRPEVRLAVPAETARSSPSANFPPPPSPPHSGTSATPARTSKLGRSTAPAKESLKASAAPSASSRFPSELVDTRW